MNGGLAVIAGVLLGLLYIAFFLGFRHKEVRAAWARRGEDGWSWKLLIPRPQQRSWAWGIFVLYGLLSALWFASGAFWIAAPSAALSLISLVQGIWGHSPEDPEQAPREGGKGVAR
jgi:multisubunit Na+/H+ antiporter MnhB subunit